MHSTRSQGIHRFTVMLVGAAFLAAAVFVRAQPGADTGEVIELSPFSVKASSAVGYGATVAGSSGRLNVAYIDLPQATSVVTSELLADARLFNSLDAVKFVPSVQATSVHNPAFSIRGLITDKLYFDGFFGGSQLTVDTAFVDRIEVVKGPSATSFGRGDPAGFINYISKVPTFRTGTDVGITVGNGNGEQDNFRYTVDNQGMFRDGKTAYRLVGAYAIGSGSRDLSEFERSGAMLSVKHRFDRGSLTVIGNISHNNNPGAVSNTSFNDPSFRDAALRQANNVTANVPVLPANDVLGYYGADGVREDLAGLAAIFEYRLAPELWLRQALRYTDVDKLGVVSAGNIGSVRLEPSGILTVSVTQSQRMYTYRGWSYQGDLLKEFKADFLHSNYRLLVGGDITDKSGVTGEQSLTPPRQPLLAFNRANPGLAFAAAPEKIGVFSESFDLSPYAQLQANFLDEKVQLTAAGRKIYFDGTATNRVNGVVTKIENSTPVVPTYSVLIKPLPWLSLYATRSKYSEPATVVAAFASIPATDPRFPLTLVSQPTTKLQEFGVKGTVLDGKVTFSASFYGMESQGVARRVQISATTLAQQTYLSSDRVNGWDLEIFGQPAKKLIFMLGAGFTNTTTNVPNRTAITQVPLSIADTVYGNVQYSFGKSRKEGFSVTLGAKTYLSGFNAANNEFLPYPDNQTVVDMGVAYGFGHGRYRASLQVNNVFSEQAVVTGVQYIMNGRLVYLSLNASF